MNFYNMIPLEFYHYTVNSNAYYCHVNYIIIKMFLLKL